MSLDVRRSSSSFGRGRTSPRARQVTRWARCSPNGCPGRRPSCSTRRPPDAAGRGGWSATRPIVIVVRDAHRHGWMRSSRTGCSPSVVVVEVGLPRLAADGARATRDATAGAASATRCWPTCCSSAWPRPMSSTRLELELREQPDALARLLERQGANARTSSERFHRGRHPLHPDRVARQLFECGALRAVPARPCEPRPGRLRDAVALHALRAAAASRRRARDRHLAVR